MNVIKSVFKYIILVLVSSIIIFTVTRMMPITPMEMLLTSYQLPHTSENIELLSSKWGLDQPFFTQYFRWFTNFLKGDWGYSLITGQSIKKEIISRLPYSLMLGFGSIFLSAIFSLVLGFLAGVEKGIWDLISRFMSIVNQVIPIFIISVIVIYIFGVRYKLIRIFVGNHVSAVIIGTMLIAIYNTGELARVVRIHYLELMGEQYILSLYSHGFNKYYILIRHGFKPVMYGLNAAIISKFASILGGATVIEFAFTIPGISYFLIESIAKRDYVVIQTYMLIIVIWMLIVHEIFELIQNIIINKLANNN